MSELKDISFELTSSSAGMNKLSELSLWPIAKIVEEP
jgi:hypothetical protein